MKGVLKRLKHPIKEDRPLGVALAIAIGATIVLTPIFLATISFINKLYLDRQTENINRYLDREKEYLIEQARQLTQLEFLKKQIAQNNLLEVASIIAEEKEKRNLGGILIANKDGVVLARARAALKRGDYIFETTTWGRILAQGGEVSSVEEGTAWPLIILGAKDIRQNDENLGAVVAAYITDDKYAKYFRERYLNKGTQVAFYSIREGVVGNSFDDSFSKVIVNNYFNTATGWTKRGHADQEFDKEFLIGDQSYFVKNVFLQGLEESPGSILIFYPRNHNYQSLVFASLITFIFLILVLTITSRRHRHYGVFTTIAILILISVFLIYKNVLDKRTIPLKEPLYTIYNSTLRLQPESAILDRAFEHRVAVEVLTGGESINAANIVLNYEPTIIQAVDIDTSRSFCNQDLFLEKVIDNQKGEIRVACLTPNPGFQEAVGNVAEIIFTPIKDGQTTLKFGSETKILANDGLGTDVLRSTTDGSYQITSPQQLEGEYKLPLVFSPSHPNSSRWYNNNNVRFTWINRDKRPYKYAFDQNPLTNSLKETTTADTLPFTTDRDGIYYFHLAPEQKDLSLNTAHYKVMIDTTPPPPPQLKISATGVKAREIVRFEFSGEDSLSGLQRTYYLKIDNSLFLPVGPTFSTAFTEEGEHIITLRVFDKAGNFNTTVASINVESE